MPHARTQDRQTSHEAAESVKNLTQTKKAILALLTLTNLTDEQLVSEYRKLATMSGLPMASESGIRSRRAELVDQGLVESVGFDKTRAGRRTTIWSAR